GQPGQPRRRGARHARRDPPPRRLRHGPHPGGDGGRGADRARRDAPRRHDGRRPRARGGRCRAGDEGGPARDRRHLPGEQGRPRRRRAHALGAGADAAPPPGRGVERPRPLARGGARRRPRSLRRRPAHRRGRGDARAAARTALSMTGRLYVVGDIHGCAGELEALLATLPLARGDTLAFVGDYLDRGPAVRAVIDLLLDLRARKGLTTVFLRGNHEDMCLAYLGRAGQWGESWMMNGAPATLRSYGVPLGVDGPLA